MLTPFSRIMRARLSLSWTSQYTNCPAPVKSRFMRTSEATTQLGCLPAQLKTEMPILGMALIYVE